MGIGDLSKYARVTVRIYVLVLILGVVIGGLTGLSFEIGVDADSAISEFAWPLGGVLFGAAWLGVGPVVALFVAGVRLGGLVKTYVALGGTLFVGTGAVSSQLVASTVELAQASMEALAFLYGAVAGMYIAFHYAEIFEFGTPIDDTAKKNFQRKFTQSLAIAVVAVGLRVMGA
jgi:hypothetical protein